MNLVASHVTEQMKLLNSIFIRYLPCIAGKMSILLSFVDLLFFSREFCFGFISRKMINPLLCHGKAVQTVLNTARSPSLQVSLLRNSAFNQ